jgi:hypothetical protein
MELYRLWLQYLENIINDDNYIELHLIFDG